MTPQSMGAIIAALEASGHVVRRADTRHGRRRVVSMTARGRKALAVNRGIRLSWTAKILAEQLDADEQRTLATAQRRAPDAASRGPAWSSSTTRSA